MKYLISLFLLILSVATTYAASKEGNLQGKWQMKCTQSQIGDDKGFIVESYTFLVDGEFTRERLWFNDANCMKKYKKREVHTGTISIGKENLNNGFNPAGTYEAKYKQSASADLGLIWVNASKTKIRLSRGIGKTQNTMLGLFEYSRQSGITIVK